MIAALAGRSVAGPRGCRRGALAGGDAFRSSIELLTAKHDRLLRSLAWPPTSASTSRLAEAGARRPASVPRCRVPARRRATELARRRSRPVASPVVTPPLRRVARPLRGSARRSSTPSRRRCPTRVSTRKFARLCALVRGAAPARPSSTRAAATAATSRHSPPIFPRASRASTSRSASSRRRGCVRRTPTCGRRTSSRCPSTTRSSTRALLAGHRARARRPGSVRELARGYCARAGALILSTDNAHNVVSRALNAPRTGLVRAIAAPRPARGRIESPATPYSRTTFRLLVTVAGLARRAPRDVPLPARWPLGRSPLQRALNRLDEALPVHGVGDILVAVARKP